MLKNNSNYILQPYLWFLFALTIFLTLFPFFKIGLTNCDDLEFYMGGSNTAREVYAQGAGRFYFLFTKPFYHIAYLIDNFYLTKVIQYSCVLLSFTVFAIVVKKIFKQTAFALSVFLLLFVFLTVTPNYFMPIIALPVYFTLSFSIFLLGILFLIKYYETLKYKHLIFSVMLSAIALLFYENYLMFIFFVMMFILAKNIFEQGVAKFLKNKTIYKEILPFAAICILYIAIYFLYRMYVQTENGFYEGTTIAKDFSFSNFFKFIWNPNRAAFPTFVYQTQQATIQFNSLLTTGHQHNFWYILINSQPVFIVNALIQCFLFFILFSNVKSDISWKKIGIGVLVSFVFLFAVNFILGISEKYNALYYQMEGYVTTYYSYFFVTLFIALLAYSCLKLGYRNKYVRTSIIAVLAVLFFCVSIIIDYSNDHLSRDWQLSHGKHVVMEKLLEEGVFDKISDEDIIYMDDFYQSPSRLGQHLYVSHLDFWTVYIHQRTNRLQLNVLYNFESLKNKIQANPQQEIYFIKKYEAQKNLDILLVLSKINANSIDFEHEKTAFDAATTNEAIVYYYSANKNFVFQFVIPQCSPEATITVNHQIQKSFCGINAIRIENENTKKSITSFTLKSDDPFLVKGFAISNIGFVHKETLYLSAY